MFTVLQSTAIGNPNTGEKTFNYLFQPFFKDWIQTDRSSHPERSMRNFSVPILISKQPVQSKEYWPSHIQLSELLLPAFPHLVNTQSRAHCWVTKTPRQLTKGLCCSTIRNPSKLSWNLEAVPTIQPTGCARHCMKSEDSLLQLALQCKACHDWKAIGAELSTAGVLSSHLRQGHRSEWELCCMLTYLQYSPRPTQPAHWCECVERPAGKWRLELPLHPPLPWFALTCQRRCWWAPRQIQTGWGCSLLCPGTRQTLGSNQPELCCLLGVASLLTGVS